VSAALASFVIEQEGALLDSLDLDELAVRFEEGWNQRVPSLG
jgi:hypothetical protein